MTRFSLKPSSMIVILSSFGLGYGLQRFNLNVFSPLYPRPTLCYPTNPSCCHLAKHLSQLSRHPARSLDFLGYRSLRFFPGRIRAYIYLEVHPSIQHQRRTDAMAIPRSAFLFFALFGFASDAQKQYRTIFSRCHKALSWKPANSKPSKIPYLPRSVFPSFSIQQVIHLHFTFTFSYNWTQPDAKAQSKYDSTDSKSGKASRFSLTSSNDATFRADDLDIEKSSFSGLCSPISTTCTTISCSPSSYYPSPSSQFDGHWSPPPLPLPIAQ